MSKTAVVLVAAITSLVLGSLGAIIITAIYASQQTAVIVGVVTGMVTTTVATMFALLQGMINNAKLDRTNAKVDTNTAITQNTAASVADLHRSVTDVLQK